MEPKASYLAKTKSNSRSFPTVKCSICLSVGIPFSQSFIGCMFYEIILFIAISSPDSSCNLLFFFFKKNKRLQRITGLAPKKYFNF
jgi:hypothetical protein